MMRRGSSSSATRGTKFTDVFQASNASKRAGEKFFFVYACVWVLLLACVVVTQLYELFTPIVYVIFALLIAVPAWILPLLFPSSADYNTALSSRYVLKANLYVAVLSVTANYFYTHYFYKLLSVRYTGPLSPGRGLALNGVPVSMYIMTHPYFCLYHTMASALLRAQRRVCERAFSSKWLRLVASALFVFVLSWTVAFLETWTISGFPYYTYPDTRRMFTVGSTFYGMLFMVTFPMFSRLDEKRTDSWSMERVVVDALATMMLVLWTADLWRLVYMPASRIVLPPVPY